MIALAAPLALMAVVAFWRALVRRLRRMDAEHAEAHHLAAKATTLPPPNPNDPRRSP